MLMAIAIASATALTACSDDEDDKTVELSKFAIDPTATTLTPGETLNVNAQFFSGSRHRQDGRVDFF